MGHCLATSTALLYCAQVTQQEYNDNEALTLIYSLAKLSCLLGAFYPYPIVNRRLQLQTCFVCSRILDTGSGSARQRPLPHRDNSLCSSHCCHKCRAFHSGNTASTQQFPPLFLPQTSVAATPHCRPLQGFFKLKTKQNKQQQKTTS